MHSLTITPGILKESLFKMQFSLIVCVAILACAYAQVYQPLDYALNYPEYHDQELLEQARYRRDVPDLQYDKQFGKGWIFGTLGSTDSGLFGRGGYKQEIFNDQRGKLMGQAYGSRVLGPYGDASNFGGRFDWADKNAKAAVDVSKQIGEKTSVSATGSGMWNVDKNTRISAGGSVTKELGPGRADVAVQAEVQHDF